MAAVLDTLEANGVTNIDTAQIYGGGWSEQVLGECEAGKRFTIDTKAYGGIKPGSSADEPLVQAALESLRKLKLDKVSLCESRQLFALAFRGMT